MVVVLAVQAKVVLWQSNRVDLKCIDIYATWRKGGVQHSAHAGILFEVHLTCCTNPVTGSVFCMNAANHSVLCVISVRRRHGEGTHAHGVKEPKQKYTLPYVVE